VRSLAALLLVLSGCAASQDPEVPQGASPAADALIEEAATPEEREELAAVRDQVDAEKRAEAATLDAEIERLEQENAKLRSRR
jgi:ubiquinone biosynthesis protein UbiJ